MLIWERSSVFVQYASSVQVCLCGQSRGKKGDARQSLTIFFFFFITSSVSPHRSKGIDCRTGVSLMSERKEVNLLAIRVAVAGAAICCLFSSPPLFFLLYYNFSFTFTNWSFVRLFADSLFARLLAKLRQLYYVSLFLQLPVSCKCHSMS